ncbi:polyketide synthase dehydratase domain-containing protein [Streptomyces sp. TRM66268-LWL]|uniref:Polyketide synthase dehydratase domain-containing protein n=1 Tax=Streptomyces polyasparticus TaxID=2767826 RepID=A0ABR7SC67_9ACTN|nr:type I polyketide synthase [Streptomyces polyasparticus]MBC9712330.1 polyketide synthase dehydratase domain-containing protein [Streptomyces polyasparticus]
MTQQEPVAIVGMAVTLPGAGDLETYWRNLVDGTEALSEVPAGRWDSEAYFDPAGGRPDAVYCRRGGFVDGLDGVTAFDPTAFGIMPGSVAGTEPDQLIALRTAGAALADMGSALPADRARVGVVLGRGGYLTSGLARLDQRLRTAAQLVRTLRELMPELGEERIGEVRDAFQEALGPAGPESVIGLIPNFAASRVANRLDLRGPSYTVDAACASSLVALDQAIAELASGRCDVMLAGGVHHCHDITLWSVFSQLRALSPSGRIRPFHREADGVLIGEGTGVVVLKRLADALRDGDRVYAVVRGVGVAGDGRAASLVNPDPGGQARAVRLAWAAAGLDPAAPGSLGLLEAHGTGTPNGDAAEMATLAEVFGRGLAPDAVIGSVKSMIGHTMPAAGVASLVKAALAVHRGVLLPTLHCDDPHPALLETRFRPMAQAGPWEGPLRRAAVNAFGFGGINAHVVLEQAPVSAGQGAAPVRGAGASHTAAVQQPDLPASSGLQVTQPVRLLRLAAANAGELARLLDADDDSLQRAATGEVTGAGHARVAVVDPTPRQLALARKAVAEGRAWGGRSDVWCAPAPLLGPAGGRTAFLFPGLEAEFTPRIDDVARHFGLPALEFADARVGDVAEHGAAVFGVGRLLAEALGRAGLAADAVAGHSVGEWTAMAVAGMYDPAEVDAFLRDFDPSALRVPGLAFAAFGAPAAQVEALLDVFPGVALSHDNAPRQSVACGPHAQVEALAARLRADGVLGQVLPFESGFHTPMLAPYLAPIEQAARGFTLRRPSVPVWSGTTAAPFPPDEAAVRELFVRHLLEPVRFRMLTEELYAAGFRAFVQLGAGQLPALVGDTLSGRPHLAVSANSPRSEGMAQLVRVAAGMWAFGAEPDFGALLGSTGGARPRGSVGVAETPAPVGPNFGAGAAVPVTSGAEPAGSTAASTPVPAGHALAASGSTRADEPARTPAVTHTVPLDLNAGLVSLDTATRDRLRAMLRKAASASALAEGGSREGHEAGSAVGAGAAGAGAPRPGDRAEAPAARPDLPAALAQSALAGDLQALLDESAETATAVLAAAVAAPVRGHAYAAPGAPGPGASTASGPTSGASASVTSTSGVSTTGAPTPEAPASRTPAPHTPRPPAQPTGPHQSGPDAPGAPAANGESDTRPTTRTPFTISLATLPYLTDHCFFRQRANWPDLADRWPVVPATTLIHLMADALPRTGAALTAVHEVRFLEWAVAEPAQDVVIETVEEAPGRYAVAFGRHARATLETGTPQQPPAAWPAPAAERSPTTSAQEMYDERWMFHGPLFRGVTRIAALGDRHVRGVLTTPPAPGALLDNVGQLLGYWLMATHTDRTVVFPVGIKEARFFGPHPEPGTDLDCHIRITALTETVLEADVQLLHGGAVWAEIHGWQDRRFDSPPETDQVKRFPERSTLSTEQGGGWQLVFECWPDPASRELMMRNQLAGDERTAFAQHPPRGKRQWLLGRIAAKDAVRRLLWSDGEGPVFPGEVRIANEPSGRPYAYGVHGRQLPRLDVSLAHCQEAAVALVRPQGPVGIDIEEIVERPPATVDAVLGATEHDLYRALGAHPEALTRIWAAKEAASKAEGTGIQGRPRDFEVTAEGPDALRVRTPSGATHRVRLTTASNPPGLPARTYVVAWTEPAATEVPVPEEPTS